MTLRFSKKKRVLLTSLEHKRYLLKLLKTHLTHHSGVSVNIGRLHVQVLL